MAPSLGTRHEAPRWITDVYDSLHPVSLAIAAAREQFHLN